MQFVKCPHCGMKNVESVKVCKSCQKPVDEAEPVELKPVKAENIERASKAKPLSEGFSDLIEGGNSGDVSDSSELDSIEVVRDDPYEQALPESSINVSRGTKGLDHIRIIEKQDPKEEAASNFRRNILPRLIQIFLISVLLISAGTCYFIYKIMDLPQYYNYFHMRKECSKSFSEAAVQLNVCENARKDVKLNFQVAEIENNFLNGYVLWKVLVMGVKQITDDPLSKNVYLLTVKAERAANNNHFIRLYINDKMAAKLKKRAFIFKEPRSMTLNGRVIAWSRSSDGVTLEIDLYDAEIVEGY